jgi:hypothetical protein
MILNICLAKLLFPSREERALMINLHFENGKSMKY